MKVLTIDGGGLLGVAPAYVLRRAGDLSKFDLFAGTSIGSVLAALAARGQINDDVVKMFTEQGKEIFHRVGRDRIRPWRTPRYRDDNLNRILRGLLPGRMGDMPKPFAATAIDMNRRALKVFSSTSFDDQMWDVWQVCRMSAAAQTYFAPWKGHSDGGPMANNPVMVAVRDAIRYMDNKIEDLEVLSLGTGEDDQDHTVGTTVGWPVWKWAFWLIPALLSGAANRMHTEFARALPLKRFVRLDFEMHSDWAMDDPDTPKQMLNALGPALEAAAKTVREF